MNWNSLIRQIHRWTSIVFTGTVIANFVAIGGDPRRGSLPLPPLALCSSRACICSCCRIPKAGGRHEEASASQGQSASELISKRIAELGDWRGETLARMRKLIKEADPDVVEEWKWRAFRCGRTTASSAPASPTRSA